MTIDVIRLGLGLLLLIVVNIVLGSVDAWLSGEFDKPKFLRGVTKGAVVALCFIVTYLVGWLNPEVVAISINGQAVNLLTAVYLVVMAGFLFYAYEVIGKLAHFVQGKVKVGELTPDYDPKEYIEHIPTPEPIPVADTVEGEASGPDN